MKKIGLYVHIPYCVKKCGYCDFYSLTDLSTVESFLDSLKKSIVYYKNIYGRLNISSIYFGGGSPSVLEGEQMAEIIKTIDNNFNILRDVEITTEANPEHITRKFLRIIKSAGIDRLSFGMQSAVEKELEMLDRSHKNSHVVNAVNLASSVGINNYSLDIIQSIPYQDIKSLETTLSFATSLSPKHLSAYMLILEPETPLFKKVKAGLKTLSSDEEADLYLFTADYLEKHGYIQYEISNFSKPGYQSKHNLTYWKGEEYLGIGPSSHSFMENKRFFYENNLKDFINTSTENKQNIFFEEHEAGKIEEYIMLNLRLSIGINIEFLKNKYNLSNRTIDKIIEKSMYLVSNNLAIYENNTIRLTKNGFLLSNLSTAKILEALV